MANIVENFGGWEGQSILLEAEAVSGTNSIVLDKVPTGKASLRLNNSVASSATSVRLGGKGASGAQAAVTAATVYFVGRYRATLVPSSNSEEILRVVSSTSTLKLSVRIDSARKLSIYDQSNALIATGTTILSLEERYYIGVKAGNGTSAAYELRINGITELSGTCDQAATNISRVHLGKQTNQNSNLIDYNWDDYWIDSGDWPTNGFRVDLLRVASNGATMSWTGGTGASDYSQINELVVSETEYIKDPTSALTPVIGLFNLQTFDQAGIDPLTSIIAIQPMVWASDDSVALSNSLNIGIRSNATDSLTTNRNTPAQGAAEPLSKIIATDPNTSAAWTKVGLEAALLKIAENTALATTRVFWAGVFVLHVPTKRFEGFFQ